MESIARHKTAISRTELSRPIRTALADGLLNQDTSLFDYGCGLGDDLRLLNAMGYQASGWDPVHRAQAPRQPAPIVNIGYVVNVIENPAERQEALRASWQMAEEILIVSARLNLDAKFLGVARDFGDGLLTSRGTFQKFFEQQELRSWIDQTLDVASVPAAPGIFYVFRDEQARSAFIASRYRRRLTAPRISKSAALVKEHGELLAPLIAQLSPTLRLFEGCARGYLGRVEGANLIKLHRDEPIVSYLSYPEFESDPHPALAFSVGVHLQTFRVKPRDYTKSRNPPILHRKESFIGTDHPLHAKFARLTRIEEQKGLYDDPSRIGTKEGWQAALTAKRLGFRGHRLISAD